MLFEGTPRGGTRSGGGRTRRYYNGNAEPARTGGLFQNEGQADSDRSRAASEGTAHGTSPCDDEHHVGASTSRSPRRAGKRSEVQQVDRRTCVPNSGGAKRCRSSELFLVAKNSREGRRECRKRYFGFWGNLGKWHYTRIKRNEQNYVKIIKNGQFEGKNPQNARLLSGAADRGRTDTVSLPLDFESSASANSTTAATNGKNYIIF